jgi:N-acyl-D-aspartate/D-glutamate deacylase
MVGEMSARYDLVIRKGTIVDGTGRQGYAGDVAVKDGQIAAVGRIDGAGIEEIDARDRLVTPGFVDIHTHYDGHVTWASRLGPSSDHGVTTVLMGNCGVGFAPCRAEDRDRLISLMEGVEDIPETVMTAGLPWNWESFPDYLDAIQRRRFDMDVAAYLPHAPLRVYVMGERAAAREPATQQDVAQMRHIARQAIDAGALGFSTSRTLNHRAADGILTPTYAAGADELVGVANGLKDAGKGVLQLISDFDDLDAEFDIIRRMAQESGRPLSTTVLQLHHAPDLWRQILERIERANEAGLPIKAQVAGRPVGVMMGLKLSRNPFMRTAGYRELEHLAHAERLAALRNPARRARILDEMPGAVTAMERPILVNFAGIYDFDADGYEPAQDRNIAARAAVAGVSPAAYAYDLITAGDGGTVLYFPAVNYADNSTAAVEVMLAHKDTLLGLGDGGAHCGLICDASLTTFMLQRWSNARAGHIPVEQVIKRLTSETAAAVGLNDRGLIAPGFRGDINVIDIERIAVGRPEMVRDLPNGGARIGQRATGFVATTVAGQITYREGVPTGALPGRLIRGAQKRPAPSH